MSFGAKIGIDLGTSTILIYMVGKGIVYNEPSVIAVNDNNGSIIAMGKKAYEIIGKTPKNIRVFKPIRNGVISDYWAVEYILKHLLSKVCKNKVFKPRVMICAPSEITDVERRAIITAAKKAGSRDVALIEEPLAAAIGSSLEIDEPIGNMIVDIGGGTTDVAVISMGRVVNSQTCKIAGNSFDKAIIRYLRTKHNVLIGERIAENVKNTIGSVFEEDDNFLMEVKGRHLVSGLPVKLIVSSDDIRPALYEPAMKIISYVKSVIDSTPPELVGDIYNNGILLTGGGSKLRGFDRLLQAETRTTVIKSENLDECVAIGAAIACQNYDKFQ